MLNRYHKIWKTEETRVQIEEMFGVETKQRAFLSVFTEPRYPLGRQNEGIGWSDRVS